MKVLQSMSWVGVAQGASLILQFGSSVCLSRLLSRADVGVYYAALAAVGLMSLFQATGLRALIVRVEEAETELGDTAFTINLVLSVMMSLSMLLIGLFAGWFLASAGVERVVRALAVVPLISALEFLPSASMERQGQFKVLAVVSISASAVSAAASVIFALVGARYMSAAYSAWIAAALSAALINIVGRRHVSTRLSLKAWRRVSRFGVQMLLTAGLHVLGDRSGEMVLGRALGVAQLGVYSRAAGLHSQVWNNVHLALGRVLFVDFAQLHREGVSIRPRYLQTVEIVTASLWPAFGGLALLAGPFISVVYGDKWADAAVPLSLLCVASLILVSITMTWEVFSATGNIEKQTKLEAINAGVSFCLFSLASLAGLRWAAVARIAGACFSVILYRRHLDSMTETSLRDLGPIYLRSFRLTLAALSPTLAVMIYFRMSAHTPLMPIACGVVLGILGWSVMMWLTEHPLFKIVKRVFRQRGLLAAPSEPPHAL